MSKGKIMCIEWEDASSHSGFYDKKSPEEYEPVFVRTVGHFIKKTKRAIIVSQERFYDSEGKPDGDKHIITVPKKMIRKIVYLEGRNEPSKNKKG